MARGSADESTGVAAADAALEWLNPGVGGWSARKPGSWRVVSTPPLEETGEAKTTAQRPSRVGGYAEDPAQRRRRRDGNRSCHLNVWRWKREK